MPAISSTPAERVSAREVALAVERDVFGPSQRGARDALDYRSRRAGLDERDRNFAMELAYGAIKMRRLLDWYLEPYVGKRDKPLPPAIAEILRLGAYQLRLMGGVATRAAVYESVALARKFGHKGTAGLVNAVLRRIAEDGREPSPGDFPARNDYLGTRYSLPTWIVTGWEERFGSAALEDILRGINEPALISLRIDGARTTREIAIERLAQAGVTASPSPIVSDVINLERGAPEGFIERFDDWVLQGESAAIPVEYLDPRPGESVLELCSGRGNKTLALGARLRGEGHIEAVDVDARKCELAKNVLAAANVCNVEVVVGDAMQPRATRADAVLLDAPCSGLGILGRQPEARWRKSADDPSRLAEQQRTMLAAAIESLRPSGRLVYSVCTTDRRECEGVVDAVVDGVRLRRSREDVVVTPGVGRRDGFYVATLQSSP